MNKRGMMLPCFFAAMALLFGAGTAKAVETVAGELAAPTITIDRTEINNGGTIKVSRSLKELSLKSIGRIVIDFCTQKDNSVHHQTREYIELCHIQLTFFQNIRVQISALRLNDIIQHHAAHS